jgi:hypothetical protein
MPGSIREFATTKAVLNVSIIRAFVWVDWLPVLPVGRLGLQKGGIESVFLEMD